AIESPNFLAHRGRIHELVCPSSRAARALPLSLVGEGGRSEWNEERPGEGCVATHLNQNPSPASRTKVRSAPSPTRGEGKRVCCVAVISFRMPEKSGSIK